MTILLIRTFLILICISFIQISYNVFVFRNLSKYRWPKFLLISLVVIGLGWFSLLSVPYVKNFPVIGTILNFLDTVFQYFFSFLPTDILLLIILIPFSVVVIEFVGRSLYTVYATRRKYSVWKKKKDTSDLEDSDKASELVTTDNIDYKKTEESSKENIRKRLFKNKKNLQTHPDIENIDTEVVESHSSILNKNEKKEIRPSKIGSLFQKKQHTEVTIPSSEPTSTTVTISQTDDSIAREKKTFKNLRIFKKRGKNSNLDTPSDEIDGLSVNDLAESSEKDVHFLNEKTTRIRANTILGLQRAYELSKLKGLQLGETETGYVAVYSDEEGLIKLKALLSENSISCLRLKNKPSVVYFDNSSDNVQCITIMEQLKNIREGVKDA